MLSRWRPLDTFSLFKTLKILAVELTDLCLLHLSFPNQPKCRLDLALPVPRTESLFVLAQFLLPALVF